MNYTSKLDTIFESFGPFEELFQELFQWLQEMDGISVKINGERMILINISLNSLNSPDWDPESDQLLDSGDEWEGEWGAGYDIFILLNAEAGIPFFQICLIHSNPSRSKNFWLKDVNAGLDRKYILELIEQKRNSSI